MKSRIIQAKNKRDKKTFNFHPDELYGRILVLKKLFLLNILPILVGTICFVAIYFGSGIFTIKIEEKTDRVAYFRQQNPRILPLPQQDPIMEDYGRLRHINSMFNNTTYSYTGRPDQMKTVHLIVDNYAAQNPLHIFVGTDVQIGIDKGSISRSVKDIFYYKDR